MSVGHELNQERDRLGISVAAHMATRLALHSEHVRYGQPLPTPDELSEFALHELVRVRGLGELVTAPELALAA